MWHDEKNWQKKKKKRMYQYNSMRAVVADYTEKKQNNLYAYPECEMDGGAILVTTLSVCMPCVTVKWVVVLATGGARGAENVVL